MSTRQIVVTLVIAPDCEQCAAARGLVEEMVRENSSLRLDLRLVDAYESKAVLESQATSHPTFIVHVDGTERLRRVGATSKRRLLRKVLPILYPDDRAALSQLRRQLGSPSETFPSGPLRGRIRQGEKIALLAGAPLFGGLSRRQLAQIARLVDEVHRDAGEVVTAEGETGDEFFIVAEGGVEVRRAGRKIGSLGPEQCFGEMSLLDDKPRSATVTTTAPTTLAVIHRADFERMLEANPSIMRALLTTLSERLR